MAEEFNDDIANAEAEIERDPGTYANRILDFVKEYISESGVSRQDLQLHLEPHSGWSASAYAIKYILRTSGENNSIILQEGTVDSPLDDDEAFRDLYTGVRQELEEELEDVSLNAENFQG